MPAGSEDLEDLLQFFYQCPVGLIEIDDRGSVRRINPAAARMLAPVTAADPDLSELFPVLDRLHPGLVTLVTGDPGRMGPLHTGRRIVVQTADHDAGRIELRLVRVDRGRVMVVCTDVTEEQRLARRTLTLAGRLREVVAATGAYRAAAAEALGVNVSGVMALEELLVRGARSPSAIARRLGLTSTTLTSTIDQLEQAGLVARVPNPADRRSVLITLAPDVHDRIGPVLDLLTGGIDRVAEGAAAHDNDVAAVLDAVTSALRTRAGAERPRRREPVRPDGDAAPPG